MYTKRKDRNNEDVEEAGDDMKEKTEEKTMGEGGNTYFITFFVFAYVFCFCFAAPRHFLFQGGKTRR